MTILARDATSIVEALANVDLRPKHFREATQIQMICPVCGGGTEFAPCLTLTIDKGGRGAVWYCHRGTCGWSDNLVIPDKNRIVRFASPARPVRKPDPVAETDQRRTPLLYDFFAKRGISQQTVDMFGVYQTTHYFHKKGEHKAGIYPAIVFPYVFNHEVVNRKYRSVHRQLAQEKDPLHTLFNVASITEDVDVVFVEGETDCMAVHEAGWRHVVTLKDGAPVKVKDDYDPDHDTDRRFEALKTHADVLQNVKKFILAGDSDAPGLAMREELARRLGRHRCWLVTWPEGCKDACEVMQRFGEDVVNECLHNAKAYPIDDVQEITGEALDAYLELPAPRILTTGTTATDQILNLPGEGRLIIVTGVPSSGKSQWTMFLMMHLMLREDRRFLVFSPEMQPWEEFAVQCAQILIGKPARRSRTWTEDHVLMSREERREAGLWLNSRLRFLSSDAQDKPPTLDWLLDRGTESALRLGITDLLIDPWNELEHHSGGMPDTDYIGRSLQKLKGFANRHGCNVWIIAHPTKLKPPSPGEAMSPPGPYDISGCHSDDTEVLTSSGWVSHPDISLEDDVCCFDLATGHLSYLPPTHVHEYDYDGPMHHYVGYSLDLLVTPNHRMVLQAAWDRPGKQVGNEKIGRPDTWSHEGWEFEESRNLRHAKYRMPLAGPVDYTEVAYNIPGIADQNAGWAFVGWFISEGHNAMNAPSVCQAVVNNTNIRASVVGLGIDFSESIYPPTREGTQPMWVARIKRRGNEAFCDWIFQNCDYGSGKIHLPPAVWLLPKRQKEIIFDALIEGDGHQHPYDSARMKQAGCRYTTTSPRLANEVQRLAIELGRYATIRVTPGVQPHHHPKFDVNIGHPDRQERVIVIPRNRVEVPYAGKVYCLTVPTGAYLTRRNGKTTITGNSAHWANKADIGLTVHTPDTMTSILLWKARFGRWGRKGTSAELDFDPLTGRYKSLLSTQLAHGDDPWGICP
jgi:twinkle protein